MAYSLFTGSYGLSSANFRVRILEVGNATPAVIALQDGTVVNSQGETILDAYGNLSVYLDDSKTFGVHVNQFLLESSDTAVAKLVRRTGFQIASAPTHADKELGPGALFYADTDPTIYYHISTDGLHFVALTGNGSPAGTDGLNNSTLFIYQRSNTGAPPQPNLSVIYTFATGAFTGLSNGWQANIPAGTDPVYVTSATASARGATDTIAPSEWAESVVLSQNGISSGSIFLFQRTMTATPPPVPDVPVTYTFANGLATGLDNNWTQSLPTSGGPYRWITTATALAPSGQATDVINASEWAAVSLLAQDGTDGQIGLNNAIVYAYQRAASAPATPSSTVTYTFATGVAVGLNNGWSSIPPAGTDPIYVTIASATSINPSDTISSGEWASPIIFAQNGTAGLNTSTVFLYKVTGTNSAPALPSAAVTYTFSTAVATGVNNGWTQSLPTSGGSYRWITTASALSTTSTDVITPSEWAPVSLFAQDGNQGIQGTQGTQGNAGLNGLSNAVVLVYQRATSTPSVPSSTVTYTFATAAITGLNNGWLTAIPAGTDPIYVTSATASGNGATDTIATGEWATPVVLAQNGTSALNAATIYLFQRTATSTAPAVPSATVTYTFVTGAAAGVNNGWGQSLLPTGGSYRWLTTATALSTGTTDTIATGEWSTPSLLAQDGAPGASMFTLIPNANMTVNGSIVTKTAGGNSFNGQVYSKEAYSNGAQMTMAINGTDDIVAGLNTDPLTSGGTGYGGIDYAVTVGSNIMQIYESGTYRGNFGAVSIGDVLGVRYDNANVYYTLNGAIVRTIAVAAGLKLSLDTSFGVLNASTSFTFAAAGAAGLNGAPGTTGASGPRGSGVFYTTLSGFAATWSDSVANTATSAGGGPIINDQVTESNSSVGFSQTRFWNGSAWAVVTQVLNGNLLVLGTVGAGTLAANAVNATNIAANSITASKLVLSDFENIVFNGKGNSADGWVASSNSPTSFSGVSFWPAGSLSSYALEFQSRDNYFGTPFAVRPGDQFYLAMDTMPLGGATSTYTFSIGLVMVDPNGSNFTWLYGSSRSVGSSGFIALAGSVTVPAGTAYAQVWIEIAGPSVNQPFITSGTAHYATNIQVRRMNGANLIVDGSISANKMVANTITAAQISATAGITAGQIDARGLSIKDGSGNVILSAGVPLASSNITPASGWLNSNISMGSNGTLSGAGGGAVTIGGLGYTGALNASVDVSLVARGYAAVAGNSISKTTGGGNWDSDVYSRDSFTGGAFISACPFNTLAHSMFGLNTDPTTDANYASIDYAWYVQSTGLMDVYESGVGISLGIPYAAGDVLAVTYDGVSVNYLQNGVVRRTVAAAAGLKLFFDSSFYDTGQCLTNVRFGPMTSVSAVTTAAANAQTTANSAVTAAADKLSKSSASILSSTVSINAVSGAGFVAGNLTWNGSGVRTGGAGIAMTPGGLLGTNSSGTTTFSIAAATGNAYFAGLLAIGTASKGTVSGSATTSSANASSTVNIGTGNVTCLTYTTSNVDMLVIVTANVLIRTNTNTPVWSAATLVIDGTSYTSTGKSPEAIYTQSNVNLNHGTGTLFNWNSMVPFVHAVIIPAGTLAAGSHTFGYNASCGFYAANGTPNVITGSSIYVEGTVTIREFLA